MVPVVSRLVPKLSETEASDFVENLIVTASAPDAVLVHLTRLLAKATLSAEASLKERQLLSMLHQRHPVIVQRITEEIVAEDEDNKDAVEELVMSLSAVNMLRFTAFLYVLNCVSRLRTFHLATRTHQASI